MKKMQVACILALSLIFRAQAGDDLNSKIKSMAESNAKLYLAPLVSGFGVAMNSGVFRSPETHSVLGFDLQVVTAMAFASKSEKTYNPKLPTSYSGGAAQTAIGSKKSSVYTSSLGGPDIELPGGTGVPFGASGAFVVPQLTVGIPFKTDVILRYVPSIQAGDVGKVDLFGFGVKHNLNQWLPIPVLDVSAGAFYQKLKIGSAFKATSTSFDVLAGKSLNLLIIKLGLYGGFGIESSSMDVNYSTDAGVVDENGNPVTTDVKFSLDGKNKARGFVGLNTRLLWLVNVNVEAGIGKYKSLSVGAGITLR